MILLPKVQIFTYYCIEISINKFNFFAMKRIIYFVLLTSYMGFAQQTGLIIENFGNVYRTEAPQLTFESDKEYKIIFDVFTDVTDTDKINPKLAAIADYLSIYSQNGFPKENLKATVLLHGAATKNALNNDAYKKLFNVENPNAELMKTLKEANIELYVSGKSYYGKVYEYEDKLPIINMSIPARAALRWYKKEGYQVINFN